MEEKKSDDEKMENIKKNVFRHPDADTLHFKRVPKKTVEIFKKFANEEFVGDYGFAFKWMVDNLLIQDVRFDQIIALLQDHEKRLDSIQQLKDKPPVKKMLSGRTIPITK